MDRETRTPRHVTVGDITIGNDLPLVFIIGPNALESRAHALEISAALAEIAARLKIPLIYKTSFDKANRSSLAGARGIGLKEGLPILAEVRERTGLPVLTDVHEKEQCAPVAKVVDILQIPAFLCRQTDLLLAAGATRKPVNVKKGQFLAPWDMKNVAAKIASTGNQQILLCERGASFGYNTLGHGYARSADHGADRLSGGVRRHPCGGAAGWPGRPLGRGTRIRARPRPRRGGSRCRRDVHRNPSGPGPGAVRGPDNGAA